MTSLHVSNKHCNLSACFMTHEKYFILAKEICWIIFLISVRGLTQRLLSKQKTRVQISQTHEWMGWPPIIPDSGRQILDPQSKLDGEVSPVNVLCLIRRWIEKDFQHQPQAFPHKFIHVHTHTMYTWKEVKKNIVWSTYKPQKNINLKATSSLVNRMKRTTDTRNNVDLSPRHPAKWQAEYQRPH